LPRWKTRRAQYDADRIAMLFRAGFFAEALVANKKVHHCHQTVMTSAEILTVS
jgi:hypothetical protein